MDKIKRKLVIGAKGVKGASVCVDWMEKSPVVGDFHETYIYLPSLSEELFEKLISTNPHYFLELRAEIFEAIKAGLIVMVVTSKELQSEGTSNYGMLPFSIKREEKRIETFKQGELNGYYSNMKYAQGFFERQVGSEYLNSKILSTGKLRFTWRIFPYVETLHNKLVAFSVKLLAESYEWSHGFDRWKPIEGNGGLVFIVPPTTAIDPLKGLEWLIRDEDDEVVDKPEWFSEIYLPGEEEKSSRLRDLLVSKSTLDKQIQDTGDELSELEKYKWLLKLKDTALERSVDRAFEFLDLPLVKGRLYQEDRWLISDSVEIPIEIKGHEQAVRDRDVRQIISRTDRAKNNHGLTKGILIANPYCDTNPKSRKISFENGGDEIITKASAFNVALLDTLTLFQCVSEKMAGNEGIGQFLLKQLVSTVGVVKVQDKISAVEEIKSP